MNRFIEVEVKGRAQLIGINHIETIWTTTEGEPRINIAGDDGYVIRPDCSYEELKGLLEQFNYLPGSVEFMVPR